MQHIIYHLQFSSFSRNIHLPYIARSLIVAAGYTYIAHRSMIIMLIYISSYDSRKKVDTPVRRSLNPHQQIIPGIVNNVLQ